MGKYIHSMKRWRRRQSDRDKDLGSFLKHPEALVTRRDLIRTLTALHRIQVRENRLHRKLWRWLRGLPWHIDPLIMLDGKL